MSDGMGREPAYLSSHATNRYFIPNWGIFTGVPDLIYNTYLRGRQRKYGTYDVGKPVQVVSAGNQYVLHSAGLQICQDTHPE